MALLEPTTQDPTKSPMTKWAIVLIVLIVLAIIGLLTYAVNTTSNANTTLPENFGTTTTP